MAKSEPSKNYGNSIQESSPKPFKDVKDFKDVATSRGSFAVRPLQLIKGRFTRWTRFRRFLRRV